VTILIEAALESLDAALAAAGEQELSGFRVVVMLR